MGGKACCIIPWDIFRNQKLPIAIKELKSKIGGQMPTYYREQILYYILTEILNLNF